MGRSLAILTVLWGTPKYGKVLQDLSGLALCTAVPAGLGGQSGPLGLWQAGHAQPLLRAQA